MKKTLFSAIVLCLIITSVAGQDFQTVNSGRIAYFSFNQFSFVRIDSALFLNGDSILYPNRSIERIDFCYSPYSPSWAGSKIVVRPDGTNIYFNHDNDPIIIKTKAALHQKWTAFQSDSVRIDAELIHYDLGSVLGREDTIKTIQFQAYTTLGTAVENPVNQMQIELSKDYGWKKAVNFNLFPNLEADYFPPQQVETGELTGMTNPRIGRQNLTWFEVFDFQPGDVLHVRETNFNCCSVNPCKKYNRRIIYSYLDRTDFPDSILYHLAREIHEIITEYPDTVSSKVSIDTIREKIVPYPEFDALPGDLKLLNDETRQRMVDQYLKNGLECKFFSETFSSFQGDSCYKRLIVDGMGSSDFIKGLGNYYDNGEVCEQNSRTLTYYKKGTVEWGTPFDFTGTDEIMITNRVKVFPNPVYNEIAIESEGAFEPASIELYSFDGKLALHEALKGKASSVDVSHLPPGLYLYAIISNNNQKASGKITIGR